MPKQDFILIGIHADLITGTLYPPEERLPKIRQAALSILEN